MHCFIDFDDVLFDRQRFTADLFDEPTQELYRQFRTTQPFTVLGFCQFVREHGGDGDALHDQLLARVRKSAAYVFPGAADFLQTLRNKGHHVAILSFDANPRGWQDVKIASSGLAELCHAVHITDGKKTDTIARLQPPQPFFFLDDKQTEISAMQAAYPLSACKLHLPGAAFTF